jgi:hypothetical protein
MSEKNLKDNIRKYEMLVDDIRKFNARHNYYLDNIEHEIIEDMKSLGIDTYGKVRLEQESIPQPIDIKTLKEQFNDKDMIDYIVGRIDKEQTIENIKIKNGFSNHIAKGYLELLENLFEIKEWKVVLKQ